LATKTLSALDLSEASGDNRWFTKYLRSNNITDSRSTLDLLAVITNSSFVSCDLDYWRVEKLEQDRNWVDTTSDTSFKQGGFRARRRPALASCWHLILGRTFVISYSWDP
jgi:hypothetical protein